jgi:hypothetical protein
MGLIANAFSFVFGGKSLSIQNPLPNNNSIYDSDIDWENSDFTDWDGDPRLLFQSPFSESITNNSIDNPKIIILAFKRTISASQIGFGENNGGDFSNLKISLLGSLEVERSVYNDQSNNIKKNSLNAKIGDELFNSIKIEFYTSDEVNLSNITIQKAQYSVVENNVHNPVSLSLDSIYPKDIDLSRSTTTGWIGNIDSLFNGLTVGMSNNSGTSPKELIIYFQRTVPTNIMGFGANTGNFSNLKITALLSGGASAVLYDGSADSTTRTSQTIPFTPLGLIGVKLEFFTTNVITLTNIVIIKILSTVSRIQATSELTDIVENINSFRNALNVTQSLVHKVGVNLFFFRETGISTTMSVDANIGDTSVTVTSATGFIIGNKVKLTSSIRSGQSFIVITDIVANVITLDRPLSVGLLVNDAVNVVTTKLNVNGSLASPVIFKIKPPNGTLNLIWQLTRLLINITDNLSMDDGKFGGIAALANGVNLRIIKGDNSIQDIANWKTNGDIALDMFDAPYTNKAPAGEYGLRGRWTFTKAEFIVELEGSEGDYFELLVQDDLTDLTNFEIKCQGRLFGG